MKMLPPWNSSGRPEIPVPDDRESGVLGPAFGNGAWSLFLWLASGWIAAAQPAPYLGVPHPIPGRIEAEHYDLGGEGVAFHGVGLVVTNAGEVIEFPVGRPGDGIPAWTSGSQTNVVLREGEWLEFTVRCEATGRYAVALRTTGPPQFVYPCPVIPPQEPQLCVGVGTASLHVEVDGVDTSGPVAVAVNTIIPRVEFAEGIHHVRVVVDHISDVTGKGGWGVSVGWPFGRWGGISFGVDWIRIVPAVVPMLPATLAGGERGFQDGPGLEARFSTGLVLVGELAGGDLVVRDTGNAALRIVSRDGRVRTLAGHPGNPQVDGNGTNAGFGYMLHTILDGDGAIHVLERRDFDLDRVRRVDPGGTVRTLFAGRAMATFQVLQWVENVSEPVRLSRVTLTDAGEVIVAGEFSHFELVGQDHGWPVYDTVTRTATFVIKDGQATQTQIERWKLTPLPPQDFGEGFHLGDDAGSFQSAHILFQTSPDGIEQEVTSGLYLASVFRAGDGTFYCVLFGEWNRISRFVPATTASRLNVTTLGPGRVRGVPATLVLPGEDIRLGAIPGTRLTQFLGWSDGSRVNPRVLRIDRDTVLTATFALVYPEPNGVLSHLLTTDQDRNLRICLVGHPAGYSYRMEVSRDLIHWTRPPTHTFVLFRGGSFFGDRVHAHNCPVVEE